jgi:hypothetical protein
MSAKVYVGSVSLLSQSMPSGSFVIALPETDSVDCSNLSWNTNDDTLNQVRVLLFRAPDASLQTCCFPCCRHSASSARFSMYDMVSRLCIHLRPPPERRVTCLRSVYRHARSRHWSLPRLRLRYIWLGPRSRGCYRWPPRAGARRQEDQGQLGQC